MSGSNCPDAIKINKQTVFSKKYYKDIHKIHSEISLITTVLETETILLQEAY